MTYIKKDVYLTFCLLALQKLRNFLNHSQEAKQRRCPWDMFISLVRLLQYRGAPSCYTYRRGLLVARLGYGGQCEGLEERDE